MKRIRMLVLAGALAVALPFGLATANATGGTPANFVSIDPYADFDFKAVKSTSSCTCAARARPSPRWS